MRFTLSEVLGQEVRRRWAGPEGLWSDQAQQLRGELCLGLPGVRSREASALWASPGRASAVWVLRVGPGGVCVVLVRGLPAPWTVPPPGPRGSLARGRWVWEAPTLRGVRSAASVAHQHSRV